MKAVRQLFFALIVLAIVATPAIADTDYTGPGTFSSLGANCGFQAFFEGTMTVQLTNDTSPQDLYVASGGSFEGHYPLELASITLYNNEQTVRVHDSVGCNCDDPNPNLPATCYTRSLWTDACESGTQLPNLGLVGVGFFGAVEGHIDWLTWSQTDSSKEIWNTTDHKAIQGEFVPASVRRCRFSSLDPALTSLTIVAP